ncbi:hypothetical protein J6590_051141 [Homalodisca vitripennis]|nr:hypothetical protein J6590_051141 [Homalodisca vitripennis]
MNDYPRPAHTALSELGKSSATVEPSAPDRDTLETPEAVGDRHSRTLLSNPSSPLQSADFDPARSQYRTLQQGVRRTTAVTGFSKPEAKLLAVTSGGLTATRELVCPAGRHQRHSCRRVRKPLPDLEQCISTRIGSARVILATVPLRHDLPEHHPVNQQTNFVNSYIEELCYRYEELNLLDLNTIKKRWFTGHGMHLRAAGKRLLAELILQHLVKIDPPGSTAKEMPPPPASPKPAEPRELPFDTYAEAIKSSPIKPANGHSQCPLQSSRLQSDINCTDGHLRTSNVYNIENHVFRASTSNQQTKLTKLIDPKIKFKNSNLKKQPMRHTTVVHQNAQMATNKGDELSLKCEELNPDLLVVTEYGFSNSFKIPNYQLANCYCRNSTKGGGVAIFVNNLRSFTPQFFCDNTDKDFEVTGLSQTITANRFINGHEPARDLINQKTIRDTRPTNIKLSSFPLAQEIWSFLNYEDPVEVQFKKFEENFNFHLNMSCPLRKDPQKPRKQKCI